MKHPISSLYPRWSVRRLSGVRGRKVAPPVLMRKSAGWGNDDRRTNQFYERQKQRSREERRAEWAQWEREEMILEQQRAKQITDKRNDLRQQSIQDFDKRQRDLQKFWQTMAKVERAKEARLSEWEEKVRLYDENRQSEGWDFRDRRRRGRMDVTEDGYGDTRFPDRRSVNAPRGQYGEPPPMRKDQGGGRRVLRSEDRYQGPERAPERRVSRSSPPFERRRVPPETDFRSSSNDRRQSEGFRRGSSSLSSNARREPDSRKDLSQWIEVRSTSGRRPSSSMPPGASEERDTGKAFQAGNGRSWKSNGSVVEGAFSSGRETGRGFNGREDRINGRRRERRAPYSRPPSR